MADWRKQALIIGDVVFFEYVSSKLEKTSSLVYLWDIDKTYLDTHFESLRGLIRTVFEKAFQKRNVPGTRVLVKSLTTSGEGGSEGDRPFPIYFISASPPQIERKIRTKLDLDGIHPYGAFFKDNLRNLKPKYFRRLTQHVGFKLQALLELRMRLKDDVKQILFGDDSETDAVVYSLYSDVCAKRLNGLDLRRVLDQYHVIPHQQVAIEALQKHMPEQDPVHKIYINLANDTDPEYYEKFGRRCVPTFNTFQMALDLFQDCRINVAQVLRVGQDMRLNYGFTDDELAKSVDDFIERRRLTKGTLAELLKPLKDNLLMPFNYQDSKFLLESLEQVKQIGEWVPAEIDYLNDFR